MTISGFTFIRNGITFDYPFRESILSLLPVVDELVIAVGNSSDDTKKAIQSIDSPKIRMIDTVWDDSLRSGGRILAEQTNIALKHIRGDWGFYLQGDEVFHEQDHSIIQKALETYRQSPTIEGLIFDYLHFYGSYSSIGNSRKWYRREVRIIRNGLGIESWGDAQGFRKDARKLRVAHVPAKIYHYGWVKPPEQQTRKLKSFHKFWHSDDWVEREMGQNEAYPYSEGGRLSTFKGTHPTVMHERIERSNWEFNPMYSNQNIPFKDRILNAVEDTTGWRVGEYRNYILEEEFEG